MPCLARPMRGHSKCSAHKHHRVCTVGLCATGRCVLVHFVMGGFGWVGLLRHCWEGLVVTASLRFVIGLVLGPIISRFPLLIFGGRLVGTVLLCKYLSQWSGWSRGGGLNLLHWWCIVYLWGWRCHKYGHLTHVFLCLPCQGLSLLRCHRLCIGSCCSGL